FGQIGLSEELLNKQGSLTPEEFAQIKQHTILGAEIAGPFRPASVLAPAVRYHHERWDGTGYPDKLQGPAIPMMARIVAAADAFHAMIRPPLPPASYGRQGTRDPGSGYRRAMGSTADRRVRHVVLAAANCRHPGRRS